MSPVLQGGHGQVDRKTETRAVIESKLQERGQHASGADHRRITVTLGLKYGTVELKPYDVSWEEAYSREREKLIASLSEIPCEIEHIGSTAVPGLPAKTILDIAIGLTAASSVESVIAVLKTAGYIYRGNAGDAGGHILVRESTDLVRTHHVHVVLLNDPQWEEYLLLRDFLRHNSKARDTYSAEKLALAAQYPMDRKSYSKGKEQVVRRLLEEATI